MIVSSERNIERKQIPRLVIAAPHSGSGKTMITMGLLAAFQKRGVKLASYKCGPDYIDPMFHSRVLGLPTRNLDTYFTDADTTRMLFAQGQSDETQLSLIEGVMGYYDGAGLATETGSTYELAKVLDAPVALIIDASGMSLSAVAVLKGFLDYREPSRITGVLFNRMSKQVYEAIRPEVELLGIRPLGYVPRLSDMELPSRHLGLVTPQELRDLRAYTEKLAERMEETVDLDALFALAQNAPEFTWKPVTLPKLSRTLNVSVARDEAFCFLYEDNLNYLREIGANIQFFSPLHDMELPAETEVLLLPGGYPELYARELSDNTSMRQAIYAALEAGVYVLAECGGFLYLTEQLEDMEGHSYPMAGWIPAKAFQTKKLGRFGYIELTPQAGGAKIRGHEFHYFDTTDNGSDLVAKKPFRDVKWECMHATERAIIGFPHLYYYSNPAFLAERLEQYIEARG
ncbi:MAG: cobyrinate a,c-diamide synthase [bacterium]|nr:cobyrinate a,c-diamide synthase [bacterium]MDY4099247.1 cobyrinate a,c-diamide synthase [Lachnospiraceae bacterium]